MAVRCILDAALRRVAGMPLPARPGALAEAAAV